MDDAKIRLYETVVDASARLRAKRAEKAESFAVDQEGLAKAYADRLNKLSEALAGQAKNQAKVVNALVEKLPIILGILCALFAVIILLVRFFPDNIQIEWVGSGQVIQLLTVVTLLLIILCLAVTDILKENTIGTLLGGIGGYVLSQGIGRAAARAATRTQQANPGLSANSTFTPSVPRRRWHRFPGRHGEPHLRVSRG
jgi:ABC-type multidrug transport system fused ATPase/permease subunit